MKLLTRSSLRHLLHHRAQLVLSVVGVALGVAVVLSIDLATGSARAAFRVSAEAVAGQSTHEITSETGTLDERLFSRIRVDVGLHASAPVVEGFASSPRLPGQALRLLGIDPFSEAPFRPFTVGGAGELDLARFLTTPNAVVLSAVTAARAGVGVGDTLSVLVSGRGAALAVVGIVRPDDPLIRAGLSDVLMMDVASAQALLDLRGALTRIDLAVRDRADSARVLEDVRALLAPGETLAAAGTQAETMAGMIDAFDVNLTALSLLALVFGTFLIYNATTFSVVQRRALLGRLRALGVTRREILGLILREAAWVGVAGSAVGMLAGVVLGRGLVRLVTRTINDLYFVVSVESVRTDPLVLAKAAALGVGATLAAALPAALEAASTEPRLAMLRSEREAKARRALPRTALLGFAGTVTGGALLAVPSADLGLGFLALFLVIGGLALLAPAGAVVLTHLLRPALVRVRGTLGAMAARDLTRSLSRTAPAIAALAVAVSVTVGLGIMIQSFRGTLSRWLDTTLRADVYVSVPGPSASRASGTLPPEAMSAFVAHPDVVGWSTYRGVDIVDDRGTYRLLALALDPRGEEAFDFVDGDADEIMRGFQRGEGALVSQPFAFRRELARGDILPLPAPAGPAGTPVLGVYRDYGSDQGAVIVPRSLYDRLFDDPGVTSLALFLRPNASSEDVVTDLLALVPEGTTITVRTNDVLRASSLDVFDRTFQITAVLRLLAFVVAFVGVLSALMAIELERARELGVLRAWGLEPGQLRSLVLTQTGLMGFVSGALAVPMGLVLSAVMIFVINRRAFGWTLDMEIHLLVLAQAVGLAIGAALLAGVYPAWRMARTSPAVALRGE
ncbi:MAG: ABC transporter permease [Gemmatimonadales bacterium]